MKKEKEEKKYRIFFINILYFSVIVIIIKMNNYNTENSLKRKDDNEYDENKRHKHDRLRREIKNEDIFNAFPIFKNKLFLTSKEKETFLEQDEYKKLLFEKGDMLHSDTKSEFTIAQEPETRKDIQIPDIIPDAQAVIGSREHTEYWNMYNLSERYNGKTQTKLSNKMQYEFIEKAREGLKEGHINEEEYQKLKEQSKIFNRVDYTYFNDEY